MEIHHHVLQNSLSISDFNISDIFSIRAKTFKWVSSWVLHHLGTVSSYPSSFPHFSLSLSLCQKHFISLYPPDPDTPPDDPDTPFYFSNVDLALEKVVQLHYHYHLNTKLVTGNCVINLRYHYITLRYHYVSAGGGGVVHAPSSCVK